MSGGKGGESTTKVEIPKELKAAAIRNLNRAEDIGSIGYMPYRGPSVAAQTPRQSASMQNTNLAAKAFGMAGGNLDPNAGMPPVQTVGGVRGYSAAPVMDSAINQIPKAQRDALASFFMNPRSGANPRGTTARPNTGKPATTTPPNEDQMDRYRRLYRGGNGKGGDH